MQESMNKKPHINTQLLQAWLDGDCSPEEKREVEQWLDESPERIDLVELLAHTDMETPAEFDRDRVKADLFKKIDEWSRTSSEKRYSRQRPKIVWWLRTAAAVLVIVMAGMISWIYQESQTETSLVYKEATSPIRTITPLTLSDGTKVELNANSRLRYPVSFSEDQREVFLEGEAFFDVVPDARRPFKVHSGQLITTVLGTEFNVKYIPVLGGTEVALVEGSVEVEVSGKSNAGSSVTLEPDQWVRYSNLDRTMTVQEGVGERILWRDGILEFKENTLLEVASTLENWYGVEIEIENSSANEIKITGTFEDQSLEHVLETLNFVAGVEYKMEKGEDNEVNKVFLSNEE